MFYINTINKVYKNIKLTGHYIGTNTWSNNIISCDVNRILCVIKSLNSIRRVTGGTVIKEEYKRSNNINNVVSHWWNNNINCV